MNPNCRDGSIEYKWKICVFASNTLLASYFVYKLYTAQTFTIVSKTIFVTANCIVSHIVPLFFHFCYFCYE